jgi:pyruvate formate lyase activating enzyme
MNFWLEIVTLLIPGFNDSEEEIRGLTDFLAGVSPDIPWHITAFHKDYKMDGPRNTQAEDLLRAAEIGRNAGLKYIYAGNLASQVGELENTRCANCNETLIERYGYFIRDYKITADGCCPRCSAQIPGRWAKKFDGQIADRPFLPQRGPRLVTILN